MDKRNFSRNAKSSKEQQRLRSAVKLHSSEDTTPLDSPFDASNQTSKDVEPRSIASKPRPKSLKKKFTGHFKRNFATYLTFGIGSILIPIVIMPLIGLNREMGETKVEVKETRKLLDHSIQSQHAELNKINSRLDKVKEEFRESKNLLSAGAKLADSHENTISYLVKKMESIRTYLVNRFNAKID